MHVSQANVLLHVIPVIMITAEGHVTFAKTAIIVVQTHPILVQSTNAVLEYGYLINTVVPHATTIHAVNVQTVL